MESASKLLALAQQFGVADALKSWFGLFNLFLETYQISVTESLHASTYSDIATSRELLRRQLQLITSLCSTTLAITASLFIGPTWWFRPTSVIVTPWPLPSLSLQSWLGLLDLPHEASST